MAGPGSAWMPTGSNLMQHQPPPQKVQEDLQWILQETLQLPTMLDELSLLRISLRRYLETGDASEAVRWAAEQMSNSVSNYKPTRK